MARFEGSATHTAWINADILLFIIITGWIKSYDRARTFDFSKPFGKPVQYNFVVKSGNPRGFNPADVTNMKMGFIDGFVSDEFCVGRQTNIQVRSKYMG